MAILGLSTALAAGCGSDHGTTALSPPFVRPSALMRYPDGSPAHAAVQLLLAIEYNDPTAAASFFVPAWNLTSRKLAREIHTLSGVVAIAGSDPRVTAEVVRGSRATLTVATKGTPVVLGLQKLAGGWKLSRVMLGHLTLVPHRTAHGPR